jgi:hypothetical protein
VVGQGGKVTHPWVRFFELLNKYPTVTDLEITGDLTLSGETASRLLATDASKVVESTDLNSWVTGTALEVEITDDGDGTITVGLPDAVSITTSLTLPLTQGSVVFVGASGVLSEDNSSLYFDDTNNRLGLLTTSPSYGVDCNSTFRVTGNSHFNDDSYLTSGKKLYLDE